MSIQNFWPFLNQVVWSFLLNLRSSIYIFWILISYHIYALQIYPAILWAVFLVSLYCPLMPFFIFFWLKCEVISTIYILCFPILFKIIKLIKYVKDVLLQIFTFAIINKNNYYFFIIANVLFLSETTFYMTIYYEIALQFIQALEEVIFAYN